MSSTNVETEGSAEAPEPGTIDISAGTEARVPGPDPDGRSYFTWASFTDPDGNGWLLQELKTRLPGREWT
jgi:hypothetical protein